jgi:excisionase family DNA binding protein
MRSIPPSELPAAEFLDPRAVADLLGVTKRTLQNWRDDRAELPFLRMGRAVRYDAADVAAYLERARVQPRSPGDGDAR